MNIEQVKNNLDDYAKDIRLNLSTVLSEEGAPDLTQTQIYLIALSVAYALKDAPLIEAILKESNLSVEEKQAAKIAATIMAMNNIYYRFIHLTEDKSFATLPAKLRMNAMSNPGIDKVSFELMCIAISAINGCGMCINAHINALEKIGTTKLSIQSAIRITAVLNATVTGLVIATIRD